MRIKFFVKKFSNVCENRLPNKSLRFVTAPILLTFLYIVNYSHLTFNSFQITSKSLYLSSPLAL